MREVELNSGWFLDCQAPRPSLTSPKPWIPPTRQAHGSGIQQGLGVLPTTAVLRAKNRIWSSLAACLIWLALESTEWKGGGEKNHSLNEATVLPSAPALDIFRSPEVHMLLSRLILYNMGFHREGGKWVVWDTHKALCVHSIFPPPGLQHSVDSSQSRDTHDRTLKVLQGKQCCCLGLQASEATVQLPCALTMWMGYYGSKQEPDV